MNDYLAKPIEEDKLYNLLLRYKPERRYRRRSPRSLLSRR